MILLPDPSSIRIQTIAAAITAIGALGTSAFGLVDAIKIFPGGLPMRGFSEIESMVTEFAPDAADAPSAKELSSTSILKSLRSNWIGGKDLASQKAIAKTLIKLRFSADNAPALAKLTGLDAGLLTSVALKLNGDMPEPPQPIQQVAVSTALPAIAPATAPFPAIDPNALTPQEQDVYGRFDVLLSSAIDEAYESGTQRYVSCAKVAACFVSILLAETAACALGLFPSSFHHLYFSNSHWHAFGIAFLVGLIATPLAPIAKDLSTALTSAANAVQAVKR